LPLILGSIELIIGEQLVLSEESMRLVRKKLCAHQVSRAVSALKHDFENKFSLALAHLRELEKLSYFAEPDSKRVLKEVNYLKTYLTRGRIQSCRSDLSSLLAEIKKWTGAEQDYGVLDEFNLIDDWFEFVDSVNAGVEKEAYKIFKFSKQAHTAIKELLTRIGNIRAAANREIFYAG
jgi:hypothetical protein